jgi:hypothetical protein
MTHDELLASITPSLTYSPHLKFGAIPVLNALRAVVELHMHFDKWCFECSRLAKELVAYPCPTIQAIEKELG